MLLCAPRAGAPRVAKASPYGMAVVMKIRSPQMIGVECPLPGLAIFQRTVLSSPHAVMRFSRRA